MDISIDKKSDIPIYMQIVNSIHNSIRSGQLNPGDKLPTVRDLSASTGISKGTIKHAYDELDKIGTIQMTQGRGTFVLGKKETEYTSKKTRAMQAIDALLDELEELGFSTRDIEIYLNLKLRERESRYDNVRIAVVDCNPESLAAVVNQLYQIPNVDVVQYMLDDVISAPYRLDDTFDIILTSANHYDDLVDHISSLKDMIVKMVPTLSQQTVIQLAEIPQNARIGIWCQSRKFATIIQRIVATFSNITGQPDYLLAENERQLADFLTDKQVVIVPVEYFSFPAGDSLSLLKGFQNEGGRLVVFDYQIDRGSMMNLEDLVKKLWTAKKI